MLFLDQTAYRNWFPSGKKSKARYKRTETQKNSLQTLKKNQDAKLSFACNIFLILCKVALSNLLVLRLTPSKAKIQLKFEILP